MKRFLPVPLLFLLWQIPVIDGRLQPAQFPKDLGSNGGFKVECWNGASFGSCAGTSGGATEARQSGSVIYDGTLAATTTAAAVGPNQAITKVMVRNDPANSVNILCGNSTTQNTTLEPGEGLSMEITNLNLLFCKTASSTATVTYIAR